MKVTVTKLNSGFLVEGPDESHACSTVTEAQRLMRACFSGSVTYDIYFTGYTHTYKIAAIKAYRKLTGEGLKEAKNLIERLDSENRVLALAGVPRDTLDKVRNTLDEAGIGYDAKAMH